jgi:hypothetical protein
VESDSGEKLDYDSNESSHQTTTKPVGYVSSATSSLIERHLTTLSLKSSAQEAGHEISNLENATTEDLYFTETTTVSSSFLVFSLDDTKSSTVSAIPELAAQNSTSESYLADAKLGKSRHRKRIGK